jgi:hypothetical protein
MNKANRYLLGIIGITVVIVFVALDLVRETKAESTTVTSSTSHFNPNATYIFAPANGTGEIKCKVLEVNGAWLRCDDPKLQWINTNTMMYARDVH